MDTTPAVSDFDAAAAESAAHTVAAFASPLQSAAHSPAAAAGSALLVSPAAGPLLSAALPPTTTSPPTRSFLPPSKFGPRTRSPKLAALTHAEASARPAYSQHDPFAPAVPPAPARAQGRTAATTGNRVRVPTTTPMGAVAPAHSHHQPQSQPQTQQRTVFQQMTATSAAAAASSSGTQFSANTRQLTSSSSLSFHLSTASAASSAVAAAASGRSSESPHAAAAASASGGSCPHCALHQRVASNARDSEDRMRNDLATAQFDLSDREGALAERERELEQLRGEFEKLQREHRELKTQQNISNWLPAPTSEHKESSSAALMKLRGENAELHRQLSAIQSVHAGELHELQDSMDRQRADITAKEEKLKHAHTKLKEFLKTSYASVVNERAKTAAAEARVTELEGKITEMEAQGLHPSVGSPILSPALRSTAAGAAAASGGAMAAITVKGAKLRRRPGPKPKHVVVAATLEQPSPVEELLTEEQQRILAASRRLGAAAAADAAPGGAVTLSLGDAAAAAAALASPSSPAFPAVVPKRRGRPPKDPLAYELKKQGLDAASKRQKVSHAALHAVAALEGEKKARREMEKELFGENESQTMAGSALNSPALRPSVPVSDAVATAAALPKQQQDQLPIVVQAVAADWAQRFDTIDELTPLQQHPLHLLTHVLCPHLLHAPPRTVPFTLCIDRLPSLLFSIFSALIRQITTNAAADNDGFTQHDLCALSSKHSQLVHRAASQMQWAVQALEKTITDSAASAAAAVVVPSGASAVAARHDAGDDEDESMLSCGSSVMSDALPPAAAAASSAPAAAAVAAAAVASCSCAKDCPAQLCPVVAQLALESLLSADRDRRASWSDAEMALECACLSLLFHDASSPTASGVSPACIQTAADRCHLLQLDLAASRSLAPLHLLEHALVVLPSEAWMKPAAATATILSCDHVDSDLALFGEEACWLSHLSVPAGSAVSASSSSALCCSACAARCSLRDLVPLVWRSLLLRGLASFPRQMLIAHVPCIAALLGPDPAGKSFGGFADEVTVGDEENKDFVSVAPAVAAPTPPPSPAALCSLLLHRLCSFTAATPSAELRFALALLRLLLVSLGSTQVGYLAHHVFLPLHARAVEALEAADAEGEPAQADPTQAALWKHVIGMCARQAEEAMRHGDSAGSNVTKKKKQNVR